MTRSDSGRLQTDEEIEATPDWLESQPGLLAPYEDQWVAVADKRVLAHGGSVSEMVEEARRLGYDDPRLIPVTPYPFIGMPSW